MMEEIGRGDRERVQPRSCSGEHSEGVRVRECARVCMSERVTVEREENRGSVRLGKCRGTEWYLRWFGWCAWCAWCARWWYRPRSGRVRPGEDKQWQTSSGEVAACTGRKAGSCHLLRRTEYRSLASNG
ncbi:hypothetical protein IF2G_03601 [Cordyceps javanica]|nr:hypothetical protein IF2G_03601 [Cordyceps javanica]